MKEALRLSKFVAAQFVLILMGTGVARALWMDDMSVLAPGRIEIAAVGCLALYGAYSGLRSWLWPK